MSAPNACDVKRAGTAVIASLAASQPVAARSKFLSLIGAAVLSLASSAVPATTINFSTWQNTANGIPGHGVALGGALPSAWSWNYTGDFSDPRRTVFFATNTFKNQVCIGPNGVCGSNNNDGIPGNEYTGFEFIYFSFDLPAGAANVELFFDFVAADDRLVVQLNDNLLGAWGGFPTNKTVVTTHLGPTGVNTFVFLDSFGDDVSVNTASLFNPGGTNVIAFWVNNTNSLNVTANAHAHSSLGDPSSLQARGFVSFQTAAIPEPGSLALFTGGLLAIAMARRRRSAHDGRRCRS